jgi:hypothetical protein
MSVGKKLIISDNDTLTNLEGMEGFTSLGGDLEITENAGLTDLVK